MRSQTRCEEHPTLGYNKSMPVVHAFFFLSVSVYVSACECMCVCVYALLCIEIPLQNNISFSSDNFIL